MQFISHRFPEDHDPTIGEWASLLPLPTGDDGLPLPKWAGKKGGAADRMIKGVSFRRSLRLPVGLNFAEAIGRDALVAFELRDRLDGQRAL